MTEPRPYTPPSGLPVADYYDCEDSERFSRETVEEAVEAYLDARATCDCDMAAIDRQ